MRLLPIGLSMAVIGFLLQALAQPDVAADWGIAFPNNVGYLAASLFLAAGAFISAGIVSYARAWAFREAAKPSGTTSDHDRGKEEQVLQTGMQAAPPTLTLPDWRGAWARVVTVIVLGVTALLIVIAIPSSVGYLVASPFVAAGGFIAAGLVGRRRARPSRDVGHPAETLPDHADTGTVDKAQQTGLNASLPALPSGQEWSAPEWLGGWLQVASVIFLSAIALLTVITTWINGAQAVPWTLPPRTLQLFGGLLVVLAFPFLVLQRVFANLRTEVLPDAPQLERLSRVPLLAFLGLGITNVLLSLGLEWPSKLERVIAIVIALVSAELILRGAATAFLPFAPIAKRRSVADSSVASLLRLTPPTFATVNSALRRQFGIDLSRSWALGFVRRAALPVGLGMAVFAWFLTGVTALGLSERAVYERLGAPVAILGPGLHVLLPWPFGTLRHVELGVVHEMPIVFSPPRGKAVERQTTALPDIEGIPQASADRLWDTTHPGEASYLIASESQGKQSFQIVDVDLRVVYRIGLSDQAARDAAYAVADLQALIRAIAGEILVRYFAHNTLLGILVQSREQIATDFRNELQGRLQELSTGIDVIAVIVEAIHPPPGAANAYHYVQAAEILAHSQIALQQADAIAVAKSAEQNATEIRNSALAAAAERVSQAHAETVLFDGDRQAYHQDGRAFLLERWLSHLTDALKKSGLVLVDHRLKGGTAPTVDLRNLDLSGAAATGFPTNAPNPQTQGSQVPQGLRQQQEQEEQQYQSQRQGGSPNSQPQQGGQQPDEEEGD